MRQFFIFAIVAACLLTSLGLGFFAGKSESAPTPAATPKPKVLAQIRSIVFDKEEVLIGCPSTSPFARFDDPRFCSFHGKNQLVAVKTLVSNPKNVALTYHYTVSGGRVTGEGADVSWDLSGTRPGNYSITATIKGKGGVSDETQKRSITLRECEDHCFICECPTLSVTGRTTVRASESVIFAANATGGTGVGVTYRWTISQGEITEGQGTPQIKVRTTREMTGEIMATVEIDGSGLCADCGKTASMVSSITK